MAAEIFTAISALRMVLDSETDADSPNNETTYAAIRKAYESLFLILLGTGFSGTVTGIATTTITHADAAQTVDVHNGRTTLITSGDAKGNIYTIDDGAAQTLIHTGDDLEADGVAIADTFVVLYDIKANLDGHDHNTINSKGVVLGDDTVDSEHYVADSIDAEHYAAGSVDQTAIGAAAVGQGELKTTTHEITNAIAGSATEDNTLTYGDYGFFPQIKASAANTDCTYNFYGSTVLGTSYLYNITIANGESGEITYYIKYRYVQASGEVNWMYVAKRKSDGKPVGVSFAPDHPTLGTRGAIHPFGSIVMENGEFFKVAVIRSTKEIIKVPIDIIVVNPTNAEVERVMARTIPASDGGYLTRAKSIAGMEEDYFREPRSFLDVFDEIFEIQESREAVWPDVPVTVALPKIYDGKIVDDWRFVPRTIFNPATEEMEPLKIAPVKRVIPKPDYITALSIKEK